jgi:signal transduction histidine kinase
MEIVGDLNSDQRQVKDIAVSGGEVLLGLINDLLDVEKLESGSMHLEIVLLSVGELIDSSIKQIVSLAEDKQLTLIRKIPDDLPSLEGDEIILRRTLVNLLGNAIKFTPAGGSVTLVAQESSDGQSIEILITDTGEGIPAEAFGRIFEKFGQVDSHAGRTERGTGLGLTFCKLSIESHGGSIAVESAPGQGTTFRLKIPLRTPSELQGERKDIASLT